MREKIIYSTDQLVTYFKDNPEKIKQLFENGDVRGKGFEIMHSDLNNIDLSYSQNSDIDGVDKVTKETVQYKQGTDCLSGIKKNTGEVYYANIENGSFVGNFKFTEEELFNAIEIGQVRLKGSRNLLQINIKGFYQKLDETFASSGKPNYTAKNTNFLKSKMISSNIN
mgnify:CR=1 FL=1